MPKAAFDAADRQFSTLLEASPHDRTVRLRRFTLTKNRAETPGYHPIEAIYKERLDAIVVTGSEPRRARLNDEEYWGEIEALVRWAEENTLASIWSCLAAHAAAFALDGIERRPLPRKRSGVYACTKASAHPLIDGWSGPIRVPHSRLNELAEADLPPHYQILTRSREAGLDAILRVGASECLLLQGHPEYDRSSLLLEYRRDLKRWLGGDASVPPARPEHYFTPEAEHALARADGPGLERTVETLTTTPQGATARSWSGWSCALYAAWMRRLSALKTGEREPTMRTAKTAALER
jgi:homoserine O-succinyltransferase